jgi:hypothetical protein
MDHEDTTMKTIPPDGTRIQLIAMPDDPNPVPAGSLGTVSGGSVIGGGKSAWSQIWVKWDNGRSLSLSVPPDQFEIVEAG